MSDRPLEPQSILQVADGVQIAFVERSGLESKAISRVGGREVIFGFAAMFAVFFVMQLLGLASAPFINVWAVVLLGTLLLIGIVFIIQQNIEMRLPVTGVAATDVPQRLVCVGLRDPGLKEGELIDRGFEPEIFSSWSAGQLNSWFFGTTIAIAVIFSALGYAVEALVPKLKIGPGAAPIGFAIGTLVAAFVSPTYYRVSPGRLELLQFSNPFRRRCERTVFDLRRGRVIVDLKQGVIFIGDREALFRWMPGRNRFAYYVLLAAISTQVVPELPEDRLVG